MTVYANCNFAQREFVLFDFDGTLANTKPGLVRVATQVLSDFGMSPEEIGDASRLVGPPFPEAFSLVYGLSAADAVQVTRAFRALYDTVGPEDFPLFPGGQAMLESLKAAGKKLSTASSKREVQVMHMLRAQGIIHLFDAVIGKQNDAQGSKPFVIGRALQELGATAENTVMVGDRNYDVAGAHELGIPCVCVLFGTATKQELLDAQVDALVHSNEELTALLTTGSCER
ncbi:MAG: HAD hydrolase-like protein [Atopobium sp.]|uniref:HAD family hydrolase n=1 Tax=Atopobium sp. TaxID=1872650 RepID=UPI002A75A8EB|nr:HAD hydrolase-like protein [Atopobium sp.]MDY2788276.1 HAD hydrolase-like protein [Atopobium sp.]MDY4522342.1 HAD hydrolase-like protein [Atopobium sp.]